MAGKYGQLDEEMCEALDFFEKNGVYIQRPLVSEILMDESVRKAIMEADGIPITEDDDTMSSFCSQEELPELEPLKEETEKRIDFVRNNNIEKENLKVEKQLDTETEDIIPSKELENNTSDIIVENVRRLRSRPLVSISNSKRVANEGKKPQSSKRSPQTRSSSAKKSAKKSKLEDSGSKKITDYFKGNAAAGIKRSKAQKALAY